MRRQYVLLRAEAECIRAAEAEALLGATTGM